MEIRFHTLLSMQTSPVMRIGKERLSRWAYFILPLRFSLQVSYNLTCKFSMSLQEPQ